jgi:hypothetical protein
MRLTAQAFPSLPPVINVWRNGLRLSSMRTQLCVGRISTDFQFQGAALRIA